MRISPLIRSKFKSSKVPQQKRSFRASAPTKDIGASTGLEELSRGPGAAEAFVFGHQHHLHHQSGLWQEWNFSCTSQPKIDHEIEREILEHDEAASLIDLTDEGEMDLQQRDEKDKEERLDNESRTKERRGGDGKKKSAADPKDSAEAEAIHNSAKGYGEN